MNYTEKRANLIQLKTNAAVIHWLAEAAENNSEHDILERLDTIAELAEQLAEDARELSYKLDPHANPGNESVEAAND